MPLTPPPLLEVRALRVEIPTRHGTLVAVDDVSFAIAPGEILGVVGESGAGKSITGAAIIGLLEAPGRIGAGEIRLEGARIDDLPPERMRRVRGRRIGAIFQDPLTSLNPLYTIGRQLVETLTTHLPLDVPQARARALALLAEVGIPAPEARFDHYPHQFSGGMRQRVVIALALAAEPRLVIADEPTTALDVSIQAQIIALLRRLAREHGTAVMLITHDRSFMDKLVTHTIGIHRRKLRKIAGNTGKYYDQIAQDEEVYEKTRVNDDRRRKEIEQFIGRFRAKARLANLVQSRIKTLKKMEKKDKLEQLKFLEFSFRNSPFSGKQALTASNVSFSYDTQKPLIKDFSITIPAGEKICVVGKNGKGKTTLLKLLAGELTPQSGQIAYHPAIKKGFFEQTNVKSLVDARTVEEEILYSQPDVDRQHARDICGSMLFSGDEALKKISVLSGGEKSRVMLGKLLATPMNLLLLDEPTNHLDMESCDALLTAIDMIGRFIKEQQIHR